MIALIAICMIVLVFLLLFFLLAINLDVHWLWNEEERYLKVKCHILRIPVYTKRITADQSLDLFVDHHQWRERMTYIFHHAEVKQIRSETIVATSDPGHTAYLYVFLQSIAEWLRSIQNTDIAVSADFDEEVLQTEGECMISMKLSQTIGELNKWRKEFSHGRE
ncbi:DUF2953 domain-containing protein [Gracilibacillus phocaeensis]|nr:DUF2953 domain-containing protein [Gracilibacillus phocaeensis]